METWLLAAVYLHVADGLYRSLLVPPVAVRHRQLCGIL